MIRRLGLIALLAAAPATPARPQSPTSVTPATPAAAGRGAINGTVYDSIAHGPLIGAHVHLADVGRDTVTNVAGAFHFGGVAAGAHVIWADHPALDALGLYSVSANVEATGDSVATVALATPSLPTLWRRACGSGHAGHEGDAVLFGQVRLGNAPASGAVISASWHGGASGGAPASTRGVHADADGSYAICGVPRGQMVTLFAAGGGATTVPVAIHLGQAPIVRRDITLPSQAVFDEIAGDSVSTGIKLDLTGGTLAGVVHDTTGRPVPGALITISNVDGEWRADADGAFTVRRIPAGTRMVVVRAIGDLAERRLIDFAAKDSVYLSVSMTRPITKLSTVTVTERAHYNARKDDIDERRRAGFGYRTDSLELARLPGLREAFNFPRVHVTGNGPRWSIYMTGTGSIPTRGSTGLKLTCVPTVWLDGEQTDFDMLREVRKEEVAIVEVFTSGAGAPLQYGASSCGVVLVWRKQYVNPPGSMQ